MRFHFLQKLHMNAFVIKYNRILHQTLKNIYTLQPQKTSQQIVSIYFLPKDCITLSREQFTVKTLFKTDQVINKRLKTIY